MPKNNKKKDKHQVYVMTWHKHYTSNDEDCTWSEVYRSKEAAEAAMRKEMESHLDALGAYKDGEDVEKIIADAFEAGDEMETHNAWLDYGDCNAAFDIFPCNII